MTILETARARRLSALALLPSRDNNIISFARTRANGSHNSIPAMFVSTRTSADTVRLAA